MIILIARMKKTKEFLCDYFSNGMYPKDVDISFIEIDLTPSDKSVYEVKFSMQHRMPTNYYYNSLNQVVKQSSPDGGTSEFWYDRLGRLAVSQNEEQKSPAVVNTENPVGRFSYTKYDELGRITEVG